MKKKIYRITFLNQSKVYELYATDVNHGYLPGLIEVSGIVFGERSSVVVDPSEEKLKQEFAGVSVTHIPFHSVIRIDEVTKQGAAKISDAATGSTVTPFPSNFIDSGKPE
jgi:hypothetical protein